MWFVGLFQICYMGIVIKNKITLQKPWLHFNIKAVSSSFAASSRYYNSVAYSVRVNSCGIKGHSAICIGLYLQVCAYMSRGWRKSQRVPFMASGFPRTIAKTQQRANQHFTAGNYITVVVMNDGYSWFQKMHQSDVVGPPGMISGNKKWSDLLPSSTPSTSSNNEIPYPSLHYLQISLRIPQFSFAVSSYLNS